MLTDICLDCFYAANGLEEDADYAPESTPLERIDYPAFFSNVLTEDGELDSHFSNGGGFSCGACYTTLGGDRFRVDIEAK